MSCCILRWIGQRSVPDHIILLLHSAVFALSNNSTEVKNESVGWQDVARNIGLGAHAASGLKSCSKIRPTTKKLCYVKEEVFEITDGGPIIDTDHPVIKEMFEIPIAGALWCSLNLYGLLLFVHFCVLHFRHHSTDAVVWSHFSHHSTDAVVWA